MISPEGNYPWTNLISIQCQPYTLERERERESHWHGVCILMKLAASLYCGCYLSHLLKKLLKSTQKVLFTSNQQQQQQKGRSYFTSFEKLNQGKKCSALVQCT